MFSHSAVVLGSTGLVGSKILYLLANGQSSASTVYAYTRRPTGIESLISKWKSSESSQSIQPGSNAQVKLVPLQSEDTSKWVSLFPTSPDDQHKDYKTSDRLQPEHANSVQSSDNANETQLESSSDNSHSPPLIVYSGLGTTRAQAGSLSAQREIDVDLNLSIAAAAQKAGVKTFVLISAAAASNHWTAFPYSRMKADAEQGLAKLGFNHVVILRPGLILGPREGPKRHAEGILQSMTGTLKATLSPSLIDSFAQDADVIARAAVRAGELCLKGEREEGLWIIGQKEIVKLGALPARANTGTSSAGDANADAGAGLGADADVNRADPGTNTSTDAVANSESNIDRTPPS